MATSTKPQLKYSINSKNNMPTNQQIEACAKEIAKSAYYKTAGCSLSVSWLSEIITRHLSAPVESESIQKGLGSVSVFTHYPECPTHNGKPVCTCGRNPAFLLIPCKVGHDNHLLDEHDICIKCGKSQAQVNFTTPKQPVFQPAPAAVESEKPCKYCGSDKGTWYRPTEPKGNFCQTCGKCCDEEVTPNTKLDEICERHLSKRPAGATHEETLNACKQACLEAIALDRQTR